MRSVALVLFISACTASKDLDPIDTDVLDSDPVVDTDVDDTDVDDTDVDDTDVEDTDLPPPACGLSTMPAGTQATEPAPGADVTFARTIEVCAGDAALNGVWRTVITDAAGGHVCAFEVGFTSSTLDATCGDCDHAYSDVVFSGATFSDAALCDTWDLNAAFVTGLGEQYSRIGTTTAPDVTYEATGTWDTIDPSDTTVRTREERSDAAHVTLAFELTFPY